MANHEIEQKLDRETIRVVALTKRLCAQQGRPRLQPEAYAVAILSYGPNSVTRMLTTGNHDLDALRTRCQQVLEQRMPPGAAERVSYCTVDCDDAWRSMVEAADYYRVAAGVPRIGLLHLLLGILKTTPPIAEAFRAFGADSRILETGARGLPQPASTGATAKCGDPATIPVELKPDGGDPLATCCTDLTAMASAGRLGPVIGREAELGRIVITLCRKKKSNPLLVGPQGVGKTCLVEALAQRIVAGDVPPALVGRRIYTVDLAGLVAGTQYRGQFEERLKALMTAAQQRADCILFVDEIHTLVGAGSAIGTLDAANIMKPALARGEICCIGATTEDEYRRFFKKDKALDRRFQRIEVGEPTPQQTITILQGSCQQLEAHHHCTITQEAIEAAVELSGRHITDRYNPDKSFDVLDEMCAQHATSSCPLGREQVGAVVAAQLGVPVETVLPTNSQREAAVTRELRRLVVGQDAAIEAVSRAVRRAFSPLRDPARPLASLVFGGPSSVGKSYVAQILAQELYGAAQLIRLNMAEFAEKHSVSRLIGSPPGYIGHGDANQLTDRVARHPNSVLLFDNFDKAHREVVELLMEMLDAGVLTDGQGNEVNFRSTFIIMTTVAGSVSPARSPMGFRESTACTGGRPESHTLLNACRTLFGEEFANRVDEFVPFQSLGPLELRQVAGQAIANIVVRLASSGIVLSCDDAVLAHLADHADNARVVRAAIKNQVEPVLAAACANSLAKTLRVQLQGERYIVSPR